MNYRDYHSTTHGEGWRMDVATVTHGLRVVAFEGARPLLLLTDRGEARSAHTEIFDGDPPFTPNGCIAQARSVAETLRAWHELSQA